MTSGDLLPLLPLIIVAYGSVALLTVGAFWRHETGIAALTILVLAAALAAIPPAVSAAPRQVTPLLHLDSWAYFYIALFLVGGIALTVFGRDYLQSGHAGRHRFYVLLLAAITGMAVLTASNHFVSFFLGLETLSVSLYGLIGFTVKRPASLEGSLKYLVLAGVSLSFLLFGMALIYSEFGTMGFSALAEALRNRGVGASALPLTGLGLILVGFAFKLAVVPFHAWAPDVYQGAPAPVTALIATGSKAAVFALLVRFAYVFGLHERASLFLLVEILAIITMIGGNLLALLQRNIKRLLAYSSVAHMGYLLVPLLARGVEGVSSVSFYFISYFITTIGAFGIISSLSNPGGELEDLDGYRGLGFRRPWLGAALGLMMLSLAGIPLTIGFMAKFYIFSAAARSGLWLLLIVGLLTSGMAAYYYLRVLVTLYTRTDEDQAAWPAPRPATAASLAALSLALVFFGIYPGPLVSLTRRVSAPIASGSRPVNTARAVTSARAGPGALPAADKTARKLTRR